MRASILQKRIFGGISSYLFLILVCSGQPVLGDSNPADPHQIVPCGNCHALLADVGDQAQPSKMDPKKCRECHFVDGTNPPEDKSVTFHANSDRNCVDCHSFHHKEVIRAGEKQFTLDSKRTERLFQCRACHDIAGRIENLSEGHKAAAAVYHTDDPRLTHLSPSETCLSCHSKNVNMPGMEEIIAGCPKPPKFDERASHRYGVTMRSGMIGARGDIRSDMDSRIPLKDGKIECQSCHEFSPDQKFQLRYLGGTKDLCLGCHEFLDNNELRPMAN